MRFDVFQFTNSGGREYNEDAVGYRVQGENGIFIVADGLGGHSYGELASSCVRDSLLEWWGNDDFVERSTWIDDRINDVNNRIMDLQRDKGATLKSTAAVLMVDNWQAVWAHVGDSRIYYLRNGMIYSCTDDHSVAYKKYQAGEISREEIGWDEDQSQLLRTLGNTERYEPEINVCPEKLMPGDGFFMCSDGAWEYLRDDEILVDMLKSENAKQWAELLLLRMMDRIVSGNDNLSMITVMLK